MISIMAVKQLWSLPVVRCSILEDALLTVTTQVLIRFSAETGQITE